MTNSTTIAEFCAKHGVARYKLTYQLRNNKIKKDSNNQFNEQEMIELLNKTKKENFYNFQDIQNQIAELSQQVLAAKEREEILNKKIEYIEEELIELSSNLSKIHNTAPENTENTENTENKRKYTIAIKRKETAKPKGTFFTNFFKP